MRVFLIPVGHSGYEPYCEVDDDDRIEQPRGGWLSGLVSRFREVVAAAERHRRRGAHDDDLHAPTVVGRLRTRLMRWIAERIAEQRLLWHLRGEHSVTLVHPADLGSDRALQALRSSLQRDADRHRRWLAIDTVALVLSAVLAIVPGPNLIAYFFAFRVVGHFLSWRGAKHGIGRVDWTGEPNAALADLRHVAALAPPDRQKRVRDIAAALELPHLPSFFERVAPKSA